METGGRRGGAKSKWDSNENTPKTHNVNAMGINMNNMMMNNMNNMNMYSQGNMLLNNMYSNMMMPGMPMPDMMSTGGMDMMAQQQMDMNMAQGMNPAMAQNMQAGPMDMNIMGGMMVDPAMMGMGMYPAGMPTNEMMLVEEKAEIVLKTCTLTPPPGGSIPQTRTRPPGCRTIFVGGLPAKIREPTVREVFEQYGRIHTLRLSNKSFCHIRFEREMSVDLAIQISGYRLKLTERENGSKSEDEGKEDSHDTVGWIHVDYAMSRDDENDYKRMQRQALRVHQADMEKYNDGMSNPSRRRSPSPKIHMFSTTNIVQICEKIKSEEHFALTLPTLIAWLERGECSKKNSSQFYTMIQATNAHVRRLFNEKIQSEEEFQECKDKVKKKIEFIILQHLQTLTSLVRYVSPKARLVKTNHKIWTSVEQVSKVFTAAMRQRVWDHFTKPQRKNIETWLKMSQEFNGIREEFLEKFDEDREIPDAYQQAAGSADNCEELMELRKTNASLQFQLEAYKNEIDVIKADNYKEMEKFKAQYIARQALDNAKPPLPKAMDMPPLPPPLPEDASPQPTVSVGCGEAKLIGIMAAFLQVHPQGASLDYVVSYVRAMFPQISHTAVHEVLQKHKDVFQQQTFGVGANIEHRWSFIVFKSISTISNNNDK